MALFGTNGVRGKLEMLTPSLSFDLSAAFASFCKGSAPISLESAKKTPTAPNRLSPIAIARDMRVTSPMLHSAACAGMLSAGKDVLDLGLCSSPVAEFTSEKSKCAGLIIITASHNAAEWNALKFVDEKGVAISRERGGAIEKMALAKSYPSAGWREVGRLSHHPSPSENHAAAVLSFVNSEKIKSKKLRLVLDFGNGTSALSRGIFEKLGCEIIPLNEKIDGTFPGRPSEPSEANVQGLVKAVRKESADFGVAWDGDSDRVVFVDEKGGWIVGDKGFAISAVQACRERKAQKEKFIVTTVATSRAVEEACALLSAKTVYTKVGAPYLSEEMAKLGSSAVSGGEEVGGIIWPRFSLAKDGPLAAAKICEMVCEHPLSEYVEALPIYFNSKTKIEVATAAQKEKGLAAAKRHAQGSKGKLNLIDGVRVDFDDGWLIVRASGTENYMRVFAEGKTQKRADALAKEYKDVVAGALS